MPEERFKTALAAVGFDNRVINLTVGSPCFFATGGISNTLTAGDLDSPLRITGSATKSGATCVISEISVTGCQ